MILLSIIQVYRDIHVSLLDDTRKKRWICSKVPHPDLFQIVKDVRQRVEGSMYRNTLLGPVAPYDEKLRVLMALDIILRGT